MRCLSFQPKSQLTCLYLSTTYVRIFFNIHFYVLISRIGQCYPAEGANIVFSLVTANARSAQSSRPASAPQLMACQPPRGRRGPLSRRSYSILYRRILEPLTFYGVRPNIILSGL